MGLELMSRTSAVTSGAPSTASLIPLVGVGAFTFALSRFMGPERRQTIILLIMLDSVAELGDRITCEVVPPPVLQHRSQIIQLECEPNAINRVAEFETSHLVINLV
jgi:hypothetical protein